MILEVLNSTERQQALETHASYLKTVVKDDINHPMHSQLRATAALLKEMDETLNNPKGHGVEVLASRKVETGAVGKVIYADHSRNHCRVEFGMGDKVSLSLNNVNIIDWEPLPDFIPRPGVRVRADDFTGDLLVLNWHPTHVRVTSVDPLARELGGETVVNRDKLIV